MQKSCANGSHGICVAVGGGNIIVGVDIDTVTANGVEVNAGDTSSAAGCTCNTVAQEVRRKIDITSVIASGVKTPRSNSMVCWGLLRSAFGISRNDRSDPTTLLHHRLDFQFKFIGFEFQLCKFSQHLFAHRLVFE